MSYLFIPRIHVRAANAMQGNYALSPAAIMAVNMFVHNLGRKANCNPQSVALLHHDAQVLGEFGGNGFWRFQPQQRRGATFINKRDYASTNKHALSLQPTASFHWRLSLLIQIDGMVSRENVSKFLRTARIAGGTVDSFGKLSSDTSLDEIVKKIPSGHWIRDRSDLIDENDPVGSLIAAVGDDQTRDIGEDETINKNDRDDSDSHDKKRRPWLAGAVLGYAMTTGFAERDGVRQAEPEKPDSSTLHAFCEPLLGLVQYVQNRTVSDIPFWHHVWRNEDTFVLQQN